MKSSPRTMKNSKRMGTRGTRVAVQAAMTSSVPEDGEPSAAQELVQQDQAGESATWSESGLERRTNTERWTSRIPTESQLRAQHQAISNAQPKSARTFKQGDPYRGSKEAPRALEKATVLPRRGGRAAPPAGWQEEEDVLAHANGHAESSKSAQAQPLSPAVAVLVQGPFLPRTRTILISGRTRQPRREACQRDGVAWTSPTPKRMPGRRFCTKLRSRPLTSYSISCLKPRRI